MKVTKMKSIREIIHDFLTELDFNVKKDLLVEDSFNIDMIATRGGLTLMVEFVDDVLNFDSVAKLKTLSSILEHKYKPISLKRMVFTTTNTVSENVSDFAKNNNILIVNVEPERDTIRRAIEEISFLKPMFREEVNVLKIVEEELREMGDEPCVELLNKIKNWYSKGGSSLVKRNIISDIDNVAKGGG